MRFRLPLILCALGAVLTPVAASALTVKNLDPEDRKIIIKENDKKSERVLKPSEVISDVCMAACEIETADGDTYDFDGNEYVTIEEGLLFIGEQENAAPK